MSERLHAKATPIPRAAHSARQGAAPVAQKEAHAEQAALAVHRTTSAPGQPLDEDTRRSAKAAFNFDFSSVRVHTDRSAADSAHALNAAAYAVGRHVVFGANLYRPKTQAGARLLAHELAHTVQQCHVPDSAVKPGIALGRKDDVFEYEARAHAGAFENSLRPAMNEPPLMEARIQRSFLSEFFSLSTGPIKAIARAFGSENYSEQELNAYLTALTKTKHIENSYDSDNKARALVTRFKSGKSGFKADGKVRALMIEEMLTGHVSSADEKAVLALLQASTDAEVKDIFATGGIDSKTVLAKLGGDQARALKAFFEARLEGGSKAALAGHVELPVHIASPFNKANLDAYMEQRIRRLETLVKAQTLPQTAAGKDPKDAQEEKDEFVYKILGMVKDSADTQAKEFAAELTALSVDEQNKAVEEVSAFRTKQNLTLRSLRLQPIPMDDQPWFEWNQKQLVAIGATRLLDAALLSSGRDIAKAAPADRRQFEALTKNLQPDQKKEATKALDPITTDTIEAAQGDPDIEMDPTAFDPKALPGETKNYQQEIEGRIPPLIEEKYQRLVLGKGTKEHGDPALTHPLSELETIAQASQIEVEKVFGSFIPATGKHPQGHGTPLVADKFFTSGKKKGQIEKKGQLHDVFQTEEASKAADSSYQGSSATFWMFYLILNDKTGDGSVDSINLRHHAAPAFKDGRVPQNKEAKLIAAAARKFLGKESKRLYEIGRGWPAFNKGHGEIAVQLFRDPDPDADRRFPWDQFETLIHEYLHSLAHEDYNKYAEHLGGENDNRGNTLIEGVDSLLTETVWKNAETRASLPEVREKVEPVPFHAGKPFDPGLLPDIAGQRYESYPNAVKLVAIVGPRNLYAAYFYGDVDKIGGKKVL